jgi:hypothetical protein
VPVYEVQYRDRDKPQQTRRAWIIGLDHVVQTPAFPFAPGGGGGGGGGSSSSSSASGGGGGSSSGGGFFSSLISGSK